MSLIAHHTIHNLEVFVDFFYTISVSLKSFMVKLIVAFCNQMHVPCILLDIQTQEHILSIIHFENTEWIKIIL